MEKGAIVTAPKKSGEPGIMEKEASILAAPKRWECILGPTVNKGMLQMTVVGSPVAMTKLTGFVLMVPGPFRKKR